MPSIKKVLIIVLLLVSPMLLTAQVTNLRGCSNNSNNDVYYILSSNQSYKFTNYTGPLVVFDPASTNCPRFTGDYNVVGNGRCCINGNCGAANVMYDFDYIQSCPLDETMPIILLLLYAFLFENLNWVRKKSLKI